MPQWKWDGFAKDGKKASGEVEAVDADDAYRKVMSTGHVVRGVHLIDKKEPQGIVSVEDIMLFSRQMHTLMKTGVPILKALNGIADSSKNPAFAAIIRDIVEELEQGKDLSKAFMKHSTTFGDFYANMVMVGETSGKLDEIFLELYRHAEFDKDMKDRIKSAFRYPTFVISAIFVAMIIVMTFVIPAFSKVYAGLNSSLPLFTRIIIGASNAFLSAAPILAVIVPFAAVRFAKWKTTTDGRKRWHLFLLRLPILGEIILKSSLSRFCKGMALTLSSGLPILQSIDVVSSIVGNDVIADKMKESRQVIERGGSMYSAYSGTQFFTPTVMQMIAVGEESGDVAGLLKEVAGMYEREIDIDIKTIGARIEPVLLVVLGAMVVVLALGVFLPVWNLSSAIMGGGK